MRVLVICSHFPPRPSPESNHALLLCENLSRVGADVQLLTSPLMPAAPEPRGFVVHPEITSWGWTGAWQLIRATRRIRPSVILLIYVGWIYGQHPMITFAPTFLRWTGRKISVVTQFENTQDGPNPVSLRQRSQWRLAALLDGSRQLTPKFGSLLARSDALIALCQDHANELHRADPSTVTKTTLIPAPPLLRIRAPDHGRARTDGRALLRLHRDPETLVLAYFGYIYPGKGVETLLEAVALLHGREPKASQPPFLLVMIGAIGSELAPKLHALRKRLHLNDCVTWLGHQDGEDCSTYLWASDIAILPFDQGVRLNNSSVAVCAMHALPIVTTEGEALEPAFKHMENVLLCPPRNPAALAASLRLLSGSAELRRQIGQGAHSMAKAHFSWDVTVEATRSVLQAALAPQRHK